MKERSILRSLELVAPSAKEGLSHEIYARQVKLLYDQAPITALVVPLNAFLVATVHVGLLPGTTIWGWALLLLCVSIGRGWLLRAYRHAHNREGNSERWCQRFVFGSTISALLWGLAPVVFFPGGSQAHQLFVAFVLAGMAAGGVVVLAPIRAASLLYVVLVLTPLICALFVSSGPIQLAMGGMTLIFAGAIISAALRIHALLVESVALRFENAELLSEVRKKNDALLAKNHELDKTLSLVRESAPPAPRVRLQEWE